ncbi:MAG TPA: hypothetical protein VHW26_11970, partial [Solirubrobacteraceae bacterium]|nr:hypothetical protein [Solirubrobacteraceae bacterium]
MRHWSTSRPRRVVRVALAGVLGGFAMGSAVQPASAAQAGSSVFAQASRTLAAETRAQASAGTGTAGGAGTTGPAGASPVPTATGVRPAAGAPSAAADAVIIALFPSELSPTHTTVESVLDRLARHSSLALGMSSATQAIYDPAQALLDISQGARIQMDRYSPEAPPELDLDVASHGPSSIGGWPLALARAATAPATALPGLLAGAVPGGAGFVGVLGGPYAGIPEAVHYFRNRAWRHPGAIIAADRSGAVASVSLGVA